MANHNTLSNYIVVGRASSGVRIEEGKSLSINAIIEPDIPIEIICRTRYLDEGYETPVPRYLGIEIHGLAESLEYAWSNFASIALSTGPILALSANSPLEDIELELAYDNTQGKKERDYLQKYIPDDKGFFRQGRNLDLGVTTNIINTLRLHNEKERILRASTQYYFSLQDWVPGREIFCLSHLYMGVEALTKAVLRQHCIDLGCTEDELCLKWGIEKTSLDSEIRKRIIFQDDDKCYKIAKKASDGLEHGFLNFKDIYKHSTQIRDVTGRYLRSAIIKTIGLDNESEQKLLQPPYADVNESWEFAQYLRGKLIGETDKLALDGHEHPYIKWNHSIKSITKTKDGQYKLDLEPEFTNIFSEELKFQPIDYRVYGPKSGKV